jgi:hypothetical protein
MKTETVYRMSCQSCKYQRLPFPTRSVRRLLALRWSIRDPLPLIALGTEGGGGAHIQGTASYARAAVLVQARSLQVVSAIAVLLFRRSDPFGDGGNVRSSDVDACS